MNLPVVSATDLAALLASRTCHDIISPLSAIRTGLELLEEMPDDADSMALVRSSTHSAVAKAQFLRLAFGSSGSPKAEVDLGDARSVAEGFMGFERANLVWIGERAYVPKNLAKLVLNVMIVANGSVPRGREVRVELTETGAAPRFTVTALGTPMRVPKTFRALLAGEDLPDGVDAHAVQYYYTLLLARECGLALALDVTDDVATFRVAPPAA